MTKLPAGINPEDIQHIEIFTGLAHQGSQLTTVLNYLEDESLVYFGRTCRFFKKVTYNERNETNHRHIPHVKIDACLNILLLGDKEAGKTSLILQLTDNTFSGDHYSTGIDYKIKRVRVDNQILQFKIFDGPHQEVDIPAYQIVMIVCDINNLNFEPWVKELDRYISSDSIIVYIGNKLDLANQDPASGIDRARLANLPGVNYFETSAKTGAGLNELFEWLAREFANRQLIYSQHQPQDDENQSKSSCLIM